MLITRTLTIVTQDPGLKVVKEAGCLKRRFPFPMNLSTKARVDIGFSFLNYNSSTDTLCRRSTRRVTMGSASAPRPETDCRA